MHELSTQISMLCIMRDKEKILLGMKKRGFGKDKWNGYGGKLEEGESIEDALIREIQEESTIDLIEYEKRGQMKFIFADIIREVHIYEGTQWHGTATETEEMKPQWFSIDEIPFSLMWQSDLAWFPYFLKKISFEGTATFDQEFNLLSIDVNQVR
jgi:8-oxo-dGTP diphosphatase/2-hydroxy-dATP diphosphatase